MTTTLLWAAGLLAYRLLLGSVAAHGFRWAYLLAVAAVGLAVPWLPVARPEVAFLPAAPQLNRVWLDEVVVTGVGRAGSDLGFAFVTLVYLLGLTIACGFVARGVWRLVRCFGESRPGAAFEEFELDVRQTNLEESPFSFGCTLFVSD